MSPGPARLFSSARGRGATLHKMHSRSPLGKVRKIPAQAKRKPKRECSSEPKGSPGGRKRCPIRMSSRRPAASPSPKQVTPPAVEGEHYRPGSRLTCDGDDPQHPGPAPPRRERPGLAPLWRLAEAQGGLANPLRSRRDQKERTAQPPQEDQQEPELPSQQQQEADGGCLSPANYRRTHPSTHPSGLGAGGRGPGAGAGPPSPRSGTWHRARASCVSF